MHTICAHIFAYAYFVNAVGEDFRELEVRSYRYVYTLST